MKVNSLIGNIVLINYKRAVYDMIKEYIKNQLKQDKDGDQLSFYDPRDPFKRSK